jgi:uncharacterized LabA/DUF88 family protein
MSPGVPSGMPDDPAYPFWRLQMEETLVFIDAGYLSKISKHLGKGKYLKYDINQFSITIAREANLHCKGVFYYTAPPFQSQTPTTEENERKAKYDKFMSRLKELPNFTVREGRLQKIDGEFTQKGVDTLLTMDLFTKPQEYGVKKIILIACDTDFVPILDQIRKNGINVILYYYTDRIRKSSFSMSNHLFTVCDEKIMIRLDHFEKSNRR